MGKYGHMTWGHMIWPIGLPDVQSSVVLKVNSAALTAKDLNARVIKYGFQSDKVTLQPNKAL